MIEVDLVLDLLREVRADLLGELRAFREPVESMDKALLDGAMDLPAVLRELRGELAGIRTRLDSLVAIEKELGYQGQRLAAIEKRFAPLAETKLDPLPVPAQSTG